MERLADQQEKDALILRKVRGAMIYPAIVLGVVIVVVIFLLVTLLPQVAQLYKDLGKSLPFLTRGLVAISQFITRFWWLVVMAMGIGLYAFFNFLRTNGGQRWFDGVKLNAPVFGNLFKKVYMARFSRTLATLLASGIPMLEAMSVTKKAIRNQYVAEAVDRAAQKVKGGKALSKSLEAESVFIVLVPQMIAIGEESGAIDDMLLKLATFYEGDVDEAVKNLSTTIEPVMMIVMGVIVALVIAAVLLPVYSLVGGGINLGQ
jgi:type IV pilus assembly protein PilC